MDEGRASRASSTYSTLREDIIRAEIRPGSKLNIRAVCERLDVGLGPVREALNRLSSEGFVTHSDQRGFSVSDIDIRDLDELTRARCWINETGLRQSIRNGDETWEEALLLAHHRMNRIARLTDEPYARSREWAKAHMDFHRALVSSSGSGWITRFCDELFEAAERYRYAARRSDRARTDVTSEHRDILSAAIERDEDRAVELLTAHFQRTANLVRETLCQDAKD